MIVPAIGSQLWNVLRGEAQCFAEAAEDITRPHADGMAICLMGLRSQRFTAEGMVDFIVVNPAAPSEVAAFRQAIADLVGTLQTVLDETNSTWAHVFVWNAQILEIFRPVLVVGGQTAGQQGYAYCARVAWTLQLSDVPAEE